MTGTRDLDEIKIGELHIWIPNGDINAVNTAKKILDIYIEHYEQLPVQAKTHEP